MALATLTTEYVDRLHDLSKDELIDLIAELYQAVHDYAELVSHVAIHLMPDADTVERLKLTKVFIDAMDDQNKKGRV